MFFNKPKLKLNKQQEARLESIVKGLGIHPETLLNHFVEEGLSNWAKKIRPKEPPKAPSIPLPPKTKHVRDHGDSR